MPILAGLLSLVASYVIGVMGRNRKMGFWGHFFASLLLTPFIGLLLVVATDPRDDDAEKPVKTKSTFKQEKKGIFTARSIEGPVENTGK
jgi:hypothetical protein